MKGSKVDMIPGVPTSARVFLEKMVERVDEIDKLIIIEMDKEGYVNVYDMTMTLGDRAWMESEFTRIQARRRGV